MDVDAGSRPHPISGLPDAIDLAAAGSFRRLAGEAGAAEAVDSDCLPDLFAAGDPFPLGNGGHWNQRPEGESASVDGGSSPPPSRRSSTIPIRVTGSQWAA